MPELIVDGLRWYATLGSAIMAGLFFTFSVFILQSLNKVAPSQAISVMQSINVNIATPLFLLAFLGTAIVSVALGGSLITKLDERQAIHALIGCVLFLVGSSIVTIAFNIPLNNTLDKIDPNAASNAEDWKSFVDSWLPWNHVRTILTLASTVFFILSIRESA